MTASRNLTILCSFLSLVSYYSKFLLEMHQVRNPFNRFPKKDVTWGCSQMNISSILIEFSLYLVVHQTHFNRSMDFIVDYDSSNNWIRSIISYIFLDKSEKPTAHVFRSLTSFECTYGRIEKEVLAIMFAIIKHVS